MQFMQIYAILLKMSIFLELRFERDVNTFVSEILKMHYLFPNHFCGKLLDYSILVNNDQ